MPTTTIPEPAAGPAENGILEFFSQMWWPVSRVTASTSPLCEAANDHALVDRGPQARAAARLASCRRRPFAPELFHRQLCGKVHQLRRRLDILVLAATGRRSAAPRERQGKRVNASGFGLGCHRRDRSGRVGVHRRSRGERGRRDPEILRRLPARCRIRCRRPLGASAATPPCIRSAACGGLLLGVVRIARAPRGSGAANALGSAGQRLDRIVRLALIDQYARQAQARDAAAVRCPSNAS